MAMLVYRRVVPKHVIKMANRWVKHLSSDHFTPGYLLYIGDDTTQLHRDHNQPNHKDPIRRPGSSLLCVKFVPIFHQKK